MGDTPMTPASTIHVPGWKSVAAVKTAPYHQRHRSPDRDDRLIVTSE